MYQHFKNHRRIQDEMDFKMTSDPTLSLKQDHPRSKSEVIVVCVGVNESCEVGKCAR